MRGFRPVDCIGRDEIAIECLKQISDRIAEKQTCITIGIFGPTFIGKKTFCRHLVRTVMANFPDTAVEYCYLPRGSKLKQKPGITVFSSADTNCKEIVDYAVKLEALPPKYSYELFMKNCTKARKMDLSFKDFSRNMTNITTCDPLTLVMCGEYVDSWSGVSNKSDLLHLLRYKERYIIGLYEQYGLMEAGSLFMKDLGDVSEMEELMDIVSLQMDNREINLDVLKNIGFVKDRVKTKECGLFSVKNNGADEVLYFTSSFKLAWMCHRRTERRKTILKFFNKMSEKYSKANSLPRQEKYSRTLICMLDIFFDLYVPDEKEKDGILNYVRMLRTSEAFQKSQSYCCRTIQSVIRNLRDHTEDADLLIGLAYDGITMADLDRDVFETNRMFSICNHIMSKEDLVKKGGHNIRSMESLMARISVLNPRFRYRKYRYETTVSDMLEYFDTDLAFKKVLRQSCTDYLESLKNDDGDKSDDFKEYTRKGSSVRTPESRMRAAEDLLKAMKPNDGETLSIKNIEESLRKNRKELLTFKPSKDATLQKVLSMDRDMRKSIRIARDDPYTASANVRELIDRALVIDNRAFSNQINNARIRLAGFYLSTGMVEEAHEQMHILKMDLAATADPKLLQRGALYELYGDYHLILGNTVNASNMYNHAEDCYRSLDCCREMAVIMSKKYSLVLSESQNERSKRIGDKLRLLCKSEIGKDDAMSGDIEAILKRLLGAD